MIKQKALLIVLDGFGIGKDSPFNAIKNARKPFFTELLKKYPASQLLTHGEAVGLPYGVMGNSEVGHMTMGAGRVIYQDLTRISKSIHDQQFFKNSTLRKVIQSTLDHQSTLHLMGLLSDGGVHSHIEHLEALLDLALQMECKKISLHLFTDGRDTPPQSAFQYFERIERHPALQQKIAKIVSISGRYYAMDRDLRWERVEPAYQAITGQLPLVSESIKTILESSYANKVTDEFIQPVCLNSSHSQLSNTTNPFVQDDDSIIFFNYRSDRARELSRAFTEPSFNGFKITRSPRLRYFCTMTQIDSQLKNIEIAYAPQNQSHLFGEWLEQYQKQQLRLAETEKYAHVTFFFNGGREKPYQGEDRILIPSPRDVATYDLKPEMSAFEIARQAQAAIESSKYDFILMNFANADMVGHTGNYEAAVKAIETLDQCCAQVIGAAEKSGYTSLITADHGNAEEMCDDEHHIHTQHTLNPVPFIYVEPNSLLSPQAQRQRLKDGTLADIMPTLCQAMQLPLPSEVEGKSLLL